MIYVQVSESVVSQGKPPLDTALLERAALETLRQVGASLESEATIVLEDDLRLHELNLQFLGVDAPTDVLSFPGGEIDPDEEEVYLGDIIISYPRAQSQAQAGGHALKDELQLLVVHGMLHLLGYDHAGEGEKAEMWAEQEKVLSRLGIGHISTLDQE